MEAGDNVFYTDNQEPPGTFCPVAVKVIQSLGLAPIFYVGAGTIVRGSSLEKEIREDFYKSKVVVIVLGRGKQWRNITDSWAVPELPIAFLLRIKCLAYVVGEITAEEMESLQLPVGPVNIRSEDDFETTLEDDLRRLMRTLN